MLFSLSLCFAFGSVALADDNATMVPSSLKDSEPNVGNPVAERTPSETSAVDALEAAKSASNYCRYLKARITESWTPSKEFEQPVEVVLKVSPDGMIQLSSEKDSKLAIPLETVAEQLNRLAPLAVPPEGKALCLHARLSNDCTQMSFVLADIDWPPYLSGVRKRIQQEWKAPRIAKSTEATVRFKIGQDGQLLKADFEKRSASSDFDQAAVRTLRRVAPFNPLPDGQPEPIEIDFTFSTNVKLAPANGPHPGKATASSSGAVAPAASMPDAQMLPDQETVLFTFQQSQLGSKRMIVGGRLGDRPVQWQLDTGAAHCVIGDSQMRSMGLQLPADAQSVRTSGFSGSATGYKFNARITVGRITRMVPLIVLPSYPHNPLLGYSFFKGFDLMIDSATQHLTFLKQRGGPHGSAAQYPYSIPFRMAGDKMMVPVEINGVTSELIWDTGADSVTVSQRDAQLFGLNNLAGRSIGIGGVGGLSEARLVQTRYIKVGPLVRNRVDVIITPPGPSVLGQNFLKNCRYTIDLTNNRILLPTPR